MIKSTKKDKKLFTDYLLYFKKGRPKKLEISKNRPTK